MNITPVISHKSKTYIHLLIEAIALLIIIYAFWHHTGGANPIRANWLWLLWLAVPLFAFRVSLHKRVWVDTPLNYLLVAFVLLTAFNFSNAPMHREGYLVVVGRPIMGIWLYLYFLEVAHVTKSLKPLLIASIGMAFVLAILALTTTQWLPEKLGSFAVFAGALPHFDYRAAASNFDGRICVPFSSIMIPEGCFNPGDVLRNTLFSFNPNEIAGALAWVTPIMAGIALGYKVKPDSDNPDWSGLAIKWSAALVFVMLFVALFLGQSRFALAGVLISLIALVWIFLPTNSKDKTLPTGKQDTKAYWRYLALGILAIIILVQVGIFLNIFTPTADSADVGLNQRDQNSVSTRLEIWNRGLRMMFDYPLTGVGIAMYRSAVSRPPYEIPYYVENDLFPPPHAHNEWIQMGADLGIPGFALYITWQIVTLQMLWYGWKSHNDMVKMTALASLAGLFAHAVYGLGDAVTLWDRYQFVLWWIVGLAGAQYVLAQSESDTEHSPETTTD